MDKNVERKAAKNVEKAQPSDGPTDGQNLTATFENKENTNEEICSICLDEDNLLNTSPENAEMKELTNCKHRFHRKCIDGWLKINKNCPFCRGEVDENELPPREREVEWTGTTYRSRPTVAHDEVRGEVEWTGTTYRSRPTVAHDEVRGEVEWTGTTYRSRPTVAHDEVRGEVEWTGTTYRRRPTVAHDEVRGEVEWTGTTYRSRPTVAHDEVRGEVEWTGTTYRSRPTVAHDEVRGEVEWTGTTYRSRPTVRLNYFREEMNRGASRRSNRRQ
ncbi:hypothetical protein niasHT_018767 [Heterodera trifolii]|uniref:RING-type domain-containing protein n=1 Tax=Heterodera trifolii TaxID=157864 RepID=A0ABD2LAX2_9BILA